MLGFSFDDDSFIESVMPTGLEDKIEMILTYVPEAEYFDFEEAWLMARERDFEAAEEALWSIIGDFDGR